MLIYPVFIPQQGCPFKCIYCNQASFVSVKEIPFESLSEEIRAFSHAHQEKSKQIAFYGGTFTALSLETREQYFQLIEPFLDDKTSIRISTRPDAVDEEALFWCKEHHVKTIELGIQDFSDEVLAASQRGYNSKTAIEACLRVKQSGFELGVQLMPGLPQSTSASILKSLEMLEEVRPDLLRIYPLIILRDTPLWKEWEAGKIKPLSLEEAISICVLYSEWAENNDVTIIKLGIPSLDNDSNYVGPYHPAFGELVKGERLIRKIVANYQHGKTIHLSGQNISLLTGHQSYNLRKLTQRVDLKTIKIVKDASLNKSEIRFSDD